MKMSEIEIFRRVYYQVYAEWEYNTKLTALILEAIVKKLELVDLQFQPHQIRIMAEQDTEIKIGYKCFMQIYKCFIQISSPDEDYLMELWDYILRYVRTKMGERGLKIEQDTSTC